MCTECVYMYMYVFVDEKSIIIDNRDYITGIGNYSHDVHYARKSARA